MKFLILRHGEAPYDQTSGERVLNANGVEETRQIVRNHLTEFQAVGHIVCSPVRRARETLAAVTHEMQLQSCPFQGKLSFDDCLRSEGALQQVQDFVDQCNDDCILVISHQPLVGQMVDYLVDQSGLGYQMGTSCLASFELITFARGCGDLKGITAPYA